jgi:hypothetical protein
MDGKSIRPLRKVGNQATAYTVVPVARPRADDEIAAEDLRQLLLRARRRRLPRYPIAGLYCQKAEMGSAPNTHRRPGATHRQRALDLITPPAWAATINCNKMRSQWGPRASSWDAPRMMAGSNPPRYCIYIPTYPALYLDYLAGYPCIAEPARPISLICACHANGGEVYKSPRC